MKRDIRAYTTILVTLFASIVFAQQPEISTPIAWIGGKPLYEAEFRFHLQDLRATCISYFAAKYAGAADAAGFWDHSFANEKPIDWLRSTALTACRKDRAAFSLMGSFGIFPAFDFNELDSLKEKENELRASFAAVNLPVYGNIHFDRQTFYAYLLSNGLLEAKRKFLEANPPTEQALKELYEKVKEEKFRLPDARTVLLRRVVSETQQDTLTIMFEPAYAKSDELNWGEIYRQSLTLKKEQQVTRFRDEAGNSCSLTCILYRNNGYMPFNQAQELVKELYAGELIRQLSDTIFYNDHVIINQKIYEQIYPR